MARPLKKGLDYFPVDKDIFRDRKIRALVRRAGSDGPTVYLWLLCEIYGTEGDKIFMNEDLILDCANDCGLEEGRVLEVIELATSVGLFDSEEKEKGVLTSEAIQSRYSAAIRRRTRDRENIPDDSGFFTEKFTVDDNGVSVDDNSVIVDDNQITVDDNPVYVDGSAQRKEKKRINKQTKQTNKSDFESSKSSNWFPPEKARPDWGRARALVVDRIWERGMSADLIDAVTVAIIRRWIPGSQLGRWRTQFKHERQLFTDSGGKRGRSHLWEVIRSDLAIIYRENGSDLPTFRRSNPEPPVTNPDTSESPPTIPFTQPEEESIEDLEKKISGWSVDLSESLEVLTRRVMDREKISKLEARGKAFLLRSAKRKLEELSATG